MLIEYLVVRGLIEAAIHCPSLLEKPIEVVSNVVEMTSNIVTAPIKIAQKVADKISDIKN